MSDEVVPMSRHAAVVTLSALVIFDIVSTLYALSLGGIEGNPIVAGIVDSPVLFVAVKLGVLAVVIVLSKRTDRFTAFIWVACSVYGVAAVLNLGVILHYA